MLCLVRGSANRQVGSGSRSSRRVGQGGEGDAGWSACPTTTTQSCEAWGAASQRYLSAEPLDNHGFRQPDDTPGGVLVLDVAPATPSSSALPDDAPDLPDNVTLFTRQTTSDLRPIVDSCAKCPPTSPSLCPWPPPYLPVQHL